jgi:long-chain fatty acid transport protein
MKKISSLIILMFLFSSLARAGGFQVALQGQIQGGMGLLGTGFLVGPSTLFYNPGGMSFLSNNYNLSVGMNPLISNVTFQYEEPSLYETTTDNPVGTPFTFYGTGKINEKISVGLGVYTPFGSSTVWGDNWRGKYIIQDISLQAIFIQPTVSYKITESLGIGAGFVYARGDVELHKALPLTGTDGEDGQATITGSTANYGFNAGVYFQPSEKLSLGLTYRSKIEMNIDDGDVEFDVPTSLSTYFPENNSYSTSLPLPASINFGLSYQVNEKIKVGADVNYVFWEDYKSLDFDFEKNTDVLTDLEQPKKYSNGAIYRIGMEYDMNEKINLRTGFYYDSPVANDEYYAPETPDAVKLGFTGGASYMAMENLSVDISFIYITGLEREATYKPENFGGTYKYNAFIPGLGVSYKF